MEFYLLPEDVLNNLNEFNLEKYKEVCRAIYELEPGSETYYQDLLGAREIIDANIHFFVYTREGTPADSVKKNLAVMIEALTRKYEEWGIAIGKIPREVAEDIAKRRRFRKSMLEVGYMIEFTD